MSALLMEIEVKQQIGNQLSRIALFLIPLASGAKDKNDKSDKSGKSTTEH
jgi:hypothetical protein